MEIPNSNPDRNRTRNCVATAEHFKAIAAAFADFIQFVHAGIAADQRPDAATIIESCQDLCSILADAHKLTGNREPEMAEAIQELERIKEDHRELLDSPWISCPVSVLTTTQCRL